MKKLCEEHDGKAAVQAAVDWMFILTLEWFGLPDEQKRHGIQLEYGFKGMSNDQLRQDLDARGRALHARSSGSTSRLTGTTSRALDVIDCPFPARFDEESKQWLLDEGADRLGRGDDALEGARADERATTSSTLQRGYRHALRRPA